MIWRRNWASWECIKEFAQNFESSEKLWLQNLNPPKFLSYFKKKKIYENDYGYKI